VIVIRDMHNEPPPDTTFRPKHAEEFERSITTRPFALSIGVMTSQKNPFEVIEIARAVPEMDFILIGSPRDKGLVADFVSRSPNNVRYLGVVSESTKLLLIDRCAIGLTTSLQEEFGWIPFEFLTRGKPVVGRPLASFLEIYGDMMIYARNVEEFKDSLRWLYSRKFRWPIDPARVRKLRERYSLPTAAKRILDVCNARVIITPDLPMDSDYVSGLFLVNWRLWTSIMKLKDDVTIFSAGIKFSAQFGLLDRTITIPSALRTIRREISRLRFGTGFVQMLKRRFLYLALFLLEPICIMRLYAGCLRRTGLPCPVIATGDGGQILAASALKIMFRARVSCLLHDVRSFHEASFFVKVYNMIFLQCLQIMDYIFVTSNSLRDELLRFYSHGDKVLIIWDDH
jgi:hypothetical protein